MRGGARSHRAAAASARARHRAHARRRLPSAAGRRGRAGKDDSGRPGDRRAAGARRGRPRADHHAGRPARAVGRRALGTLRPPGRRRRFSSRSPAASRTLPYGVNPWTTWPIAIVSMDYVKRADVLPAVARVRLGRHRRRRSARRRRRQRPARGRGGAGRARPVRRAAHGDAAQRRRPRVQVAMRHRRRTAIGSWCFAGPAHVVRQADPAPRASPAAPARATTNIEMHARLEAFGRAVRERARRARRRDVWLALAVLRKRAYSGAHALRLTIARRLASLGPEHGSRRDSCSCRSTTWASSTPATKRRHGGRPSTLRDRALERQLLTSLAAAARGAAVRETKLTALVPSAATGSPSRSSSSPNTGTRSPMHTSRGVIGRPVVILHGGLVASRTVGGAASLRRRRARDPAGDRCRRRRAQSSPRVPDRHQPRAALEPDASRTANRQGRSDRPAPDRSRVPSRGGRERANSACSKVFDDRIARARTDSRRAESARRVAT